MGPEKKTQNKDTLIGEWGVVQHGVQNIATVDQVQSWNNFMERIEDHLLKDYEDDADFEEDTEQ